MGNVHYPKVDLGKYFNHKQKVFLINVSENRDQELYESLSGTIVGRSRDFITLQTPYSTGYTTPENASQKRTFKLTTEAMGNGIQVITDLVRVESGKIFHLKPCSNFEMYQRRQVPRIDTIIKLLQVRYNDSLEDYRREFLRIRAQLMNQGVLPDLMMRKAIINLGVGGILVECETKGNPSLLSLFFLELHNNETPVCALGDLVWDRLENNMRMCGYRFILISKVDQERIRSFIRVLWKKKKIVAPKPRNDWELLDRMMYDETFA